MSRIAVREPKLVTATPRKAMTAGRKKRCWTLSEGLCAWCRKAVDQTGPDVIYDHRVPLALGGVDEDENIRPLHTRPCNAQKTYFDIKSIRKAQRIAKKIAAERTPSRLKSRGFDKSRTRKMNGKVVERRPTAPVWREER